jgi:fermentation-respiration switch protein FrsA (DUF1100 family)
MKCILAVGISCAVLAVQAQEVPTDLTKLLETLKNDQSGQMSMIAESMLGKNGGNKLFYFPTKDTPATPAEHGLVFENVTFSTSDQVKLHGWLIPVAKGQTVKGTVVFSHGNAGSIGHHLSFVDWLPRRGYQLLMYDYRGFGKSEGIPSREGLVRDVEAAFSFVQQRKETAAGKIFSFGHSLGGAKSITALARASVPGLRAVITDGTFASYEQMAMIMAGNFGKNLVSDELSPKDVVAQLPVPLLMIHGTDDEVVPLAQGKALFEAARPRKTFYQVSGGRHGDSLSRNKGEYREKMLEWMAQCK